MARLFYGNFDFEETLAAPSRSRSRSVQRVLAELAPTWIAVAEPGDLFWCPQPIDQAFFDELAEAGLPHATGISAVERVPTGCDLVPWGWTPEVFQLAERLEIDVHPPPLDAVRAVNSRQFAREQELAHGLELPGSGVASAWSELVDMLDASLSEQWVIKSEFSQAGRDRLRVDFCDNDSDAKLKAWATPRLKSGALLFVEPWLDTEAEAGIQLTIGHDGTVQVEGIVGTTYRAGALAVGDFTLSADEVDAWREAITIAIDVAGAAADMGYFGPLGIDAMHYRDADGSTKLRPIQDINARWTMGRLCLGHQRLLRPEERGRWLLGPSVADLDGGSEVPGRRIVRTSPDEIGGAPVRLRSAVVIDSSS